MAIEFNDSEIARIKKDDAIGCGCAILVPALIAPFATNFFGLTPWPVLAIFLGLAIILYLMKTPTGKLPWKAEVAFALLGLVTSTFVAVMIASYPEKDENNSPNANASSRPAPVPTVTSSEQPVTKDKVRITVDEIVEKFAKNQIAGAQFFEKHTAVIPGTAVRVREALGTGILVLSSSSTDQQIELGFNESSTRLLGKVEPGDHIEAICPNVQEAMGQVIIACSAISIIGKDK